MASKNTRACIEGLHKSSFQLRKASEWRSVDIKHFMLPRSKYLWAGLAALIKGTQGRAIIK